MTIETDVINPPPDREDYLTDWAWQLAHIRWAAQQTQQHDRQSLKYEVLDQALQVLPTLAPTARTVLITSILLTLRAEGLAILPDPLHPKPGTVLEAK